MVKMLILMLLQGKWGVLKVPETRINLSFRPSNLCSEVFPDKLSTETVDPVLQTVTRTASLSPFLKV